MLQNLADILDYVEAHIVARLQWNRRNSAFQEGLGRFWGGYPRLISKRRGDISSLSLTAAAIRPASIISLREAS